MRAYVIRPQPSRRLRVVTFWPCSVGPCLIEVGVGLFYWRLPLA